MARLLRFLKPYWWMIVLAIALLFLQANCDLALPDYMSRIVNVGIQQNGVASPIPQAIRQSEMNRVKLFMTEADAARMLASYSLVQQGAADYDKYVKDYPGLAKEPVYILNTLSTDEETWKATSRSRSLAQATTRRCASRGAV